ncbi:L-arabinolactonase [Jannaschia seosinensis]|uniref:L-arabinolactonase n=1 Tax=Jannaschia seosinensis TaxID=313367 RepID=A0A0M7B7W1_9RHOB|nr:SMP-30/gluconolactonase/LRE family protein [Jannaschia seosinensis]CUH22402.1 L-arabinolactonase [Jannaschia seosinensis]
MIRARIHDERRCTLGEGPFWHPDRAQFFWCDITGKRLLSVDASRPLEWKWDESISALGWIDHDTLMVAGASALWQFDIDTGDRTRILDLEADKPGNRSNDGRADPLGGFWIGTMGREAEPGAGAIYRYFRGELRKLFEDITIPNAICFAPGGDTAYFADTARGAIWKQHIDRAGWPSGRAELFVDLSIAGLAPDGAVCDTDGNVWVAEWGAWRVACHGPDGRFRAAVEIDAAHVTCPAFGGPDLRQLFVTTALQGREPAEPGAGCTWVADVPARGKPETRIIL